ncbi:YhdP family protein [Alteromonas hispanica]|uniref:TIGR02099 family protein n=1 Tax=Alteromonas hispanica TaxID=315421 RepID=A0A6L9MVI2_9ALTE|nr:TIGR02099 family protein [Alteromonas hispanica]
MTKFSSAAAYLLKKFWLLLAVLLVLFALILSAARYALPHIEHNKYLLEDYINQQYGVNLSIDSVHAVWERSGPSIVLNSVSLAKDEASPVALDIRQIYVELDFWQSLRQQLISSPRFELRGLQLDIDADRVSGSSKNNFPVITALERLFLEQLQSFSLEDGTISLTRNGDTNSFDVTTLSWNNFEERHQGLGRIKVDGVSANSASFVIDIQGTKDEFEGVFYAKAEDLDISPWVSDLIKTKRPLAQSRANLEIWTRFSESAVNSVQAELNNSLLQWGDEQIKTVTGITGGSLQALPTTDGWNIRVDQLKLNSSNATLTTDVIGTISNNGNAVFNTIKPVEINPFLLLLPLFLDDTSEDEIRALDPKGELATLQLQWQHGSPALAAKVLDLKWSQTDAIPGLSSLDADIFWYKHNGAVFLESSDSELSSKGIIKKDVHVNNITADIYVYPLQSNEKSSDNSSEEISTLQAQRQRKAEPRRWGISSDNIIIDTDSVSLTSAFNFDLSSGHLSLFTDVDPLPLAGVSDLFPAPVMSDNLDNYLTRAFVGGGEIEAARVLWFGKINEYPFTEQQGIFQASVDISKSDFLFSSKWPALSELDLSLRFINKGLFMTSSSAELEGVKVRNMSAAIPTFKRDAVLTIDAAGDGAGESLTSLMMASSIKDSLGKVLEQDVQVAGPLSADIHLHIPLNGEQVRATGTAALAENTVYIPKTNMRFERTKGNIAFDNGNIDAKELSAQFLNQAVTIDIHGQQKEEYLLNVGLAGRWHVHPLANYVNTELTDYVDGETQWQTNVDLILGKDTFSYTADLNADLTATQSVLPEPFNTAAGTSLPLNIQSSGNLTASNVNATLGEDIRFTGTLPHKEMQFSRAHLALGESDIANIGTGFSIAANLDNANVKEWFTTISMLTSGNQQQVSSSEELSSSKAANASSSSSEPTKNGLFGTPSRIFAKASELTFAGHAINDVQINAQERNNNWLLDIGSAAARGTILVNGNLAQQGIEINADYLNLIKPEAIELEVNETNINVLADFNAKQSDDPFELDPRSLPPVYFRCESCIFHGIDLGNITLDIVKTDSGLKARQLVIRSPEATITAKGDWEYKDGASISRIEGNLLAPDVGQMLKEYKIESGIKDSEADVAFNIQWPNSPMDLQLNKLQGDVEWSLSDGYLTELSDQGSRIFTLFSLNSLVRKLSLDFRDVFAKGFFYDDMGGTLTIVDGKAYTDDTEIDGGAGEIEIMGFTDLGTGDLNYNVSFAPNVTGNLPFLVYFLATPPTALAAIAIDQVLTSAKVISNVNYRVSGTISEPQFEEVERNSKDISLPAQNVPVQKDPLDRPLTEDDVRRIKMEVIDG